MYIYTPKSGTKLLASHGLTVVTMHNGSHHVPQDCAELRCGDGSRAQRARFRRVAPVVCRMVGGVAVDERGRLALYTRSPGAAAHHLRQAGVVVETGLALLAQGWASLQDEAADGLGVEEIGWDIDGAALRIESRAEAPRESLELRVAWSPRDDRPGRPWLWTLGASAWRSAGVDFEVSPAPHSVMGVSVGERDWRRLASLAMVSPDGETGQETGTETERVALDLAERLRYGLNPWCPSPGGYVATWDGAGLHVGAVEHGAIAGRTVDVVPTAVEIAAARAVVEGLLTGAELDTLTGGRGAGLAADPGETAYFVCPPGARAWHSVESEGAQGDEQARWHLFEDAPDADVNEEE